MFNAQKLLYPSRSLHKGLVANGSLFIRVPKPLYKILGHRRVHSEGEQSKHDSQKPPVVKKDAQERLQRIISKSKLLSRLNKNPKFSGYVLKLGEAGVTSTITSFLLMHELTAIVPLFSLWWVFYQLDLPDQYELPLYFTNLLNQCGDAMERLVGEGYSDGFDRNRLILSGAISYALVKFLYPLRVLLSLWAAPYMGKWLLAPFYKLVLFFKRNSKRKVDN